MHKRPVKALIHGLQPGGMQSSGLTNSVIETLSRISALSSGTHDHDCIFTASLNIHGGIALPDFACGTCLQSASEVHSRSA
jgi:hypothetical protein